MPAAGPVRATVGVLAALAVVMTAHCSTRSDEAQGFVAATRSRHEGAARTCPYENLSELLGNTLYKVGDRPAAPATVAVVTGEFLAVEPGRAFTVEGNDAPDGTEIGFERPDAQWRTMHARFAVDEIISGSVPAEEITVGFAFWAKSGLAPIREDLLNLGRVALFLERSPVFAYDTDVFAVALDGDLVAPIDRTGHLSLPTLGSAEEKRLLRGSSSVSALRNRASEPVKVFELDPTGTEKRRGLPADSASTTSGRASTPSTSRTTRSAGRVVARLELPALTLRSGGSLAARITVVNDSGAEIQVMGCGSMYAVLLTGPRHHPTASWPLCAQQIIIPMGESTYPVHVAARYNECSAHGGHGMPACLADGSMPGIPPGTYEVTTVGVSDEVPVPAPVSVQVTP